MATSSAEPLRPAEGDEPSRTFGPPTAVVIGTLVAGVVFVIVLEFLVIISFIGQRLWQDPRMGSDLLFTLPLVIWVVIAIAAGVGMVRVLTSWLHIDEHGFRLRSLARRTVEAQWGEVGRVIAVRSIQRGSAAAEMLDAPDTAYDGVYVLSREDQRLIAVSSRFFGQRAQETVLRRARESGVQVDLIEAISTQDLLTRAPGVLTFADRHPNLILVIPACLYIAHNVLTFAVWGL